MGKYSTNPDTMLPIGVTPASLGGAPATPTANANVGAGGSPVRRTPTTTTPGNTQAAPASVDVDLTGCHRAGHMEIIAPETNGVTLRRGADGILYACPRKTPTGGTVKRPPGNDGVVPGTTDEEGVP